ncbi:hypothetical protein E2E30_01405 [Sphingomonas sp. AAP5]|uniref:hypothetical protein n=1 Tax=Sphingomonas sp. AAP5 TaxID=1523415 RepID=UPI0010575DE4|nr:hypothetical protein [Sphingomonas sp. AAP5]QBM74549.1 hypothetical protein E2E30_01405 [Sphingomonas sp. AAP5]
MRIRPRGPEVYRKRIERALAKGLSKSAARGHAKIGEPTVSGLAVKPDTRLGEGFARVANGESLTATARALRISRERLRRSIAEHGDYVREGRRYAFKPSIENSLPLYSGGRLIDVKVDDEGAKRLGAYMAAVGKYLPTGRFSLLEPYVGQGVTDVRGIYHPFETDPDTLYELRAKG